MRVMVLVLAALLMNPLATHAEEASIKRLDWLIGEWTFRDEQISGDWVEEGSRICRYEWDVFIVCDSIGVTGDKPPRPTRWYFSYNKADKRYEAIGIYSNWPRKGLYIIEVGKDNHTLELTYGDWEAEGAALNRTATVTYNGKDEYTWKLFNGDFDPETGKRALGFQDIARRVPDSD